MRSRFVILVILFVSLVFGLFFARSVYLSRNLPRDQFIEKRLRLLTYSTFVGASGPGAAILETFQKENNCKVDVVTAGDAGLLLERLKLAQASDTPFDVVLGLDQLMLADAAERFQWKSVPVSREGWHSEVSKAPEQFIPFDWSPLSFVYREGQVQVPTHFTALTNLEYRGKFALQDPRSSSPGLQFFHWVKAVKGKDAVRFLQDFKSNVQSVAPSWSFSYGLFKKNQASFVFSYVTSLAFHWGTEGDRQYQILSLAEGHPVQTEFAAVAGDCRQCDLAVAFVQGLLKPDVQKEIMQKNFMFPVLKGIEAGTIFAELPQLKVIETSVDKDLSDWDQVFKH